jgi:hypothetical protein
VTPGAAGTVLAAICPTVSAALEAHRPSTAVKDEVYAEYGIPASQQHLYRIDQADSSGQRNASVSREDSR